MIKRLYDRGVRKVLLFVADGVIGLEERIKEYFPKADFQLCVVHKVRNTLNKIRTKDRKKIVRGLKNISSLHGRGGFKRF